MKQQAGKGGGGKGGGRKGREWWKGGRDHGVFDYWEEILIVSVIAYLLSVVELCPFLLLFSTTVMIM